MLKNGKPSSSERSEFSISVHFVCLAQLSMMACLWAHFFRFLLLNKKKKWQDVSLYFQINVFRKGGKFGEQKQLNDFCENRGTRLIDWSID